MCRQWRGARKGKAGVRIGVGNVRGKRPAVPGGRAGAMVAVAAVVAMSGAVGLLAPGVGQASSHREAPLIAGDPQADSTDTYSFVSPDKPDTVTLIGDWIPFEEPNGGPNFYPFATDAHYNINVDTQGTGKPDTTFTWEFQNHYKDNANQILYNTGVVNNLTDPTLNFTQTYTLTETTAAGTKTLVDNAIAAPSDVGKASMPDYGALRSQATKSLPGGGQTYAGQADDPFFIDLRIFDLLYGGNLSETGQDTLAGYNVNTLAVQVPKSELALKGDPDRNPVIGVWNTTERKSTNVLQGANGPGGVAKSGDYVQVSRLGNPLVNELVVPVKFKDAFNAIPPATDHTIQPVVDKVTDPIVPKVIQKVYGIKAPAAPRNDLAEIFLTGIAKNAPTLDGSTPPIQADLNSQVLNKDVTASAFVPAEEERLNMGVPVTANPNRLGLLGKDKQGFPNGRRLTDDVVDIELQALEGAAQTGSIVKPLAAGDGVNANQKSFGTSFPYVALPNTAAVNHARTSATPNGGVDSGAGGTAGGVPIVPIGAAFAGGALLVVGGGWMLRRRRQA